METEGLKRIIMKNLSIGEWNSLDDDEKDDLIDLIEMQDIHEKYKIKSIKLKQDTDKFFNNLFNIR